MKPHRQAWITSVTHKTAYVGLVAPSVESIQNAKFDTQAQADAANVA